MSNETDTPIRSRAKRPVALLIVALALVVSAACGTSDAGLEADATPWYSAIGGEAHARLLPVDDSGIRSRAYAAIAGTVVKVHEGNELSTLEDPNAPELLARTKILEVQLTRVAGKLGARIGDVVLLELPTPTQDATAAKLNQMSRLPDAEVFALLGHAFDDTRMFQRQPLDGSPKGRTVLQPMDIGSVAVFDPARDVEGQNLLSPDDDVPALAGNAEDRRNLLTSSKFWG